MSVIVSFRVDKEIKRKMEEYSYINWSEVVRRAILEKIREEERKKIRKDLDRIRKAVLASEKLSKRIEGWSSVKEIKRWREAHSS